MHKQAQTQRYTRKKQRNTLFYNTWGSSGRGIRVNKQAQAGTNTEVHTDKNLKNTNNLQHMGLLGQRHWGEQTSKHTHTHRYTHVKNKETLQFTTHGAPWAEALG